MQQLKVAIVGCGQIADGHVEEIQRIATGEVVAVVDREPLMAEQLAVRYQIPRHYSDLDELLEQERPDVVHIATPPQSHLPLALKCLDAGCHIYVEKPFAIDHAESQEIIARAEAGRRKVTIGHTYELDPPALDMRALIASGAIGTQVHVETYYGYDMGSSFGKAIMSSPDHWVHALPGKLFQNNINHLLNKISEFVLDERPLISAAAFQRNLTSFGDVRDEIQDELRVMIVGESVTAYATFSSAVRPTAHFERVYGTGGTLHVDYVTRSVAVEHGPTQPSAIGRLLPTFSKSASYLESGMRNVGRFLRSEYRFFDGLNRLITMFYDCILQDLPPPIPHRDILRLAWWIDEIARQINGSERR